MTARYCQWREVNASLLVMFLSKRTTDSDAFTLAHPNQDPLLLDQHVMPPKTPPTVTHLQRRHCQ
jgi:hypothetical protein